MTMTRFFIVSFLICVGVVRSAAQDGVGGIASGATLELKFIASVPIGSDVASKPLLKAITTRPHDANAPITLTRIDDNSNSPFVLSVWTKPTVDCSNLRLIVIDETDTLVEVLNTKVQVIESNDGNLATFFGSLTKNCTSSCRVHVVQILGSEGFCRPYSNLQAKDGG
jgi:hypothetical protein